MKKQLREKLSREMLWNLRRIALDTYTRKRLVDFANRLKRSTPTLKDALGAKEVLDFDITQYENLMERREEQLDEGYYAVLNILKRIINELEKPKTGRGDPWPATLIGIQAFVEAQNTWMELTDEDENMLTYATREHGNMEWDSAGKEDIEHARRLGKAILERFKNQVTVHLYTVDEWTQLDVGLKRR